MTRATRPGITLRCTVVSAHRGTRDDLAVEAPPGATVADLVACWSRHQPGPEQVGGVQASINGRRLQPGHTLGAPPLLDGCIILLHAHDETAAPDVGLYLDVVAGPDAGRSLPMPPGRHTVGRCEPADLRLDDSQVSRLHARLRVTTSGVMVDDVGSTNGTTLWPDPTDPATQRQLRSASCAVPVGGQLRLGASGLQVRVPAVRPATTRATGTGQLEVNRPPRERATLPKVTLTTPALPTTPAPAGMPWIGMAVPLALSLGAAWLLRQPTYLLFGLMSPLVLAGTALADRVGRRRRRRADERRRGEQLDALDRRAALALAEEHLALRRLVADPVTLQRVATTPASRLWERTSTCDDLLVVGLGTGDVPSARLAWLGPDADDPGVRDPDGRRPRPPVLRHAPVTLDVVEHRHLGLAGDRGMVLRLARWVLGQLVVGHGPQTLQLFVVTSDTDEWRWTRWAPHTVTGGGAAASDLSRRLDDLVRDRHRLADGGDWRGTRLVVLLDGDQLAELPGVADALGRGPAVGVHVLALAPHPESLPSACDAVVTVDADGTALVRRAGSTAPLTVDGTRRAWAETVARALAPLRDATPSPGRLPCQVRLLDLLEVDGTDPAALGDLWSRTPRCTSAVVGSGLDGPVVLDLADDGPHALVAGTTGSGKSELLRTLVASLALVNRPDELTLLLVDYKGGAAFRECEQLPHTAGLVTDLDEHLAERALVALDAEMSRRERLLQQAGCQDLTDYLRRRELDPTLPALARLVLVVDEFRVLATELPQFLDGVVRVASTGRSLGVHVVLATQRPGGVVTADITANVNLRICLRVRDRADSDDVLDAPDAAAISAETPGRAMARRGGDALLPFQTARVDGHATAPPNRVTARPVDPGLPVPTGAVADDDAAPRDLFAVVDTCRRAAARLGVATARPLWAPPLPHRLSPAGLAQAAAGGSSPGTAPLGLVDLPHLQRHDLLGWHPRHDTHLAIAGAARTGRTCALATLVAGLVPRWSPSDLHLHAVHAGAGGLDGLPTLPHTGTVATADRPRQVARLICRLAQEVARRRGTGGDRPSLVLLIDDWETVVGRLEDIDHGRPVDDLLALIRDGGSVGLRAVLTGGRGVLMSRVTAVVGERLLLRPNDPTDLLLAGVASSAVPALQPPGRAVRARDGAQVQLALPPPWDELATKVAARWPPVDTLTRDRAPLRLRPLPSSVSAGDLVVTDRPASWALLGVGGDEPAPVGIDLATERFVLVAGPPGSGRSTTLTTMAWSLQQKGARVLVVCPGPSPLESGPWRSCRLDRTDAAPALLAEDPAAVLLVDDVDHLREHPVETLLAAAGDDPRRSLVVAASTASTLGTHRGVAALGRCRRTGVLLQPRSPVDGDVLGARAEIADETLPGRGLLVLRGVQTPVQVAAPPSRGPRG